MYVCAHVHVCVYVCVCVHVCVCVRVCVCLCACLHKVFICLCLCVWVCISMAMSVHNLTKHHMLVIQEVALCAGDEKLTAIGVLATVGLLIRTTPKDDLSLNSMSTWHYTHMGGTRSKFKSWKVTNHTQNASPKHLIAFWKISESWNLAVALKVPPMHTLGLDQTEYPDLRP